jgi:hypothetical protein
MAISPTDFGYKQGFVTISAISAYCTLLLFNTARPMSASDDKADIRFIELAAQHRTIKKVAIAYSSWTRNRSSAHH